MVEKNIILITIGAITSPNAIPNLNQSLFNGVKRFEFINPKIRKFRAIIIDQILIDPSCIKGHKLITKKTKKNAEQHRKTKKHKENNNDKHRETQKKA